jgi:predicted ester cyclase
MHELVFEIASPALARWRLLPRYVRVHVAAFAGTPDAERLSIAFPRLVRRVTAVVVGEPITVRLECEGLHEGMWGGIICPTRRRVTFEEQHEIVAKDGRIVSDRMTLDLQAMLTQLCGPCGADSEETARVVGARGEWNDLAWGTARRSSRETRWS